MKLIKLSEEHYVVVDDSEIKEGDFVYSSDGGIFKRHIDNPCQTIFPISKITRSTQPLEQKTNSYSNGFNMKSMSSDVELVFDKIEPLYLSEVKELLDDVDVEKKVESLKNNFGYSTDDYYQGAEDGYKLALEDNKERKYTEEDLRKAFKLFFKNNMLHIDEIIQTIQPKTEWDVEFIDGKLKLI